MGEMKLKGAEKKKKMLEKFKKKGEQVMNNLATKSLIMSVDDNEELCLFCHDKPKANNPLIHMASVSKDKTITCSFYGEDDKSRVSIHSCMHSIHLHCYLKMMSENNLPNYNCPLCSTPLNCILPTHFNPDDLHPYEISCSSITISLGMNCRVFNSDSLVTLIFKHLVNSKGLNNLLRLERYESERFVWRRINKHLETLMLQIFHKGGEQ